MLNLDSGEKYYLVLLLLLIGSSLGYTIGITESTRDVLDGCIGDATVEILENGKTLIRCSNFEYEM